MIDVTAFKTCFVAVTLKYANIKLSTVCCQHILSLSLSVVEIEMVEVLRDCNLQHHFCFNFVVEIFRDSISRPQGTKVGERFMNSYPTFLINFPIIQSSLRLRIDDLCPQFYFDWKLFDWWVLSWLQRCRGWQIWSDEVRELGEERQGVTLRRSSSWGEGDI